jgi:sulfate/thiosulfate transport system permease protein
MKKYSVLPGFGPALGLTLLYLSLIVLIPLAGMVWKTLDLSFAEFLAKAFSPRALAAYRVSFGCALLAALINVPSGLLVAWVLVRYKFPGKRIVDALVDLPFALPTAVAGISLTTLYAENGWVGSLLVPLGIRVAYTPIGITLAMVFIGIPFVVRSVQPVLEELDPDLEEAAATLGANRLTAVRRVVLPLLFPSLITGFSLAFARAVGEYGSIVFIAGNMPMQTEIAPLLIITQLEQYEYAAATAIGVVMLSFSFLSLLAVNGIQWWSGRKYGQV